MGIGDGRRYTPALLCVVALLAACQWDSSTTGTSSSSSSSSSNTNTNTNSSSSSSSSNSSPAAPITIHGTPTTTATVGSRYALQAIASAPAGTSVGYSIANKPRWATFSTTNGMLEGVPQSSDVGTYKGIIISASDGSGTASLPGFSITVKAAASGGGSGSGSGGGSVTRPAYNTGNGFFVLNGKLYDPNGNEFRIRGVNRNHWDSNSAAGIALSGANTVRTFIDFTQPVASNVSLIEIQNIDNGEVPVVTYAGTGAGETLTSRSTDPATLSAALSAWTAQASQWSVFDKYLIVNVA